MDGRQLEGASLMSADSATVPQRFIILLFFFLYHRAAYGNEGC